MTRFQMTGLRLLGAAAMLMPVAAQAQIQGHQAVAPRYGSPNSMQFQATTIALDLSTIDDDRADADATPESRDADTIGGAFTYFGAGFQKGQRFEGRYQHQRRLGEGTRARLLIDLPLAVVHADKFVASGFTFTGGTAVYGTLSAGVELPVKPNWLITPRIAYSNLQAGQFFDGDGELLTASVTSRFKIAKVGRGDLTIGNMASYTRTIDTFLARQPFFSVTSNYVLRNGLAYQFPLKSRFMGRQTSIRASYVFTYTGGAQFLPYRQFHELGVNFGVRTREAEQKNGFEQMRVGLLYTHARHEFDTKSGYDAVTLTLGYRF